MASSTRSSRVIVFGKVGAGKSTLCNMLFARHPSPGANGFKISDSAEAVTSTVEVKEGNGWIVVDTIGMGEANLKDPTEATPTEGTQSKSKDDLAREALKKFLKETRNEYMYIIFVAEKGRITDETTVYWKAFQEIFKGGESNFVVVYTKTDQKWFQESREVLEKLFTGCSKFIGVDFPPPLPKPKDDKDNNYSSDAESSDEGVAEDERRAKRRERSLKRRAIQERKLERIWKENLARLENTLRGYSLRPVQTETYSMNNAKIDQRADSIFLKLKGVILAIFSLTMASIGSGLNLATKAEKVLWAFFSPFL